jgi:hypothetical protein
VLGAALFLHPCGLSGHRPSGYGRTKYPRFPGAPGGFGHWNRHSAHWLHTVTAREHLEGRTCAWSLNAPAENSERGLPRRLVDALVDAFALAAAAEPEPAKKTKLRAVADGLAGAARDIAVAVVAKKLGD